MEKKFTMHGYRTAGLTAFFGKSIFVLKLHKNSWKFIGNENNWWYLFVILVFASMQFCKAYYPYGEIVRRSVPTTPFK